MGREKIDSVESNIKKKKELDKIVDSIEEYYDAYTSELNECISDIPQQEQSKIISHYFKEKTNSLRNELRAYISLGYTEEDALKRVLPKAYANVRAASLFLWNKPHHRVQLIGGILLNDGYVSQMATGEGKTLTAALPVYLNALLGKGAHVVTPNGYLAMANQKEMSQLYNLLGLTCGLVEERGKINEEEIQLKIREILSSKIKKYTEKANNEQEKQRLENAFFKDKSNASEIRKARKYAIESIRAEEVVKKRKAYNADITYGSASAFAFDYLFDDISLDPSGIVQRLGLPNFAVIDEVDSVLFDDAVTPFTLSGRQEDEELEITEEEKKKADREIDLANMAIYNIYKENKSLIERNSTIGKKDQLILTVKDEDSFEALQMADTEETIKYDMTRAIIIDNNTKQYKLTTLGETMIFKYYYGAEINKILLEHRDAILNIRENGEKIYREGYDYTINSNGRLLMEPRAFAHLVTSGYIKELTDVFEEFGINELVKNQPQIDNAIRAWFVLKEDVDYMLRVPEKSEDVNERIISLVMNGRTAEGRVYSNGLQQAIEAKEKALKRGIKVKKTEIKDTLASIPTAAFFARYDRFGGMTGTAAVDAFKELYGLDTFDVPRNRPRIVINHGDRMYASTDDKNEAIFEMVKESYDKGQPVLISTTSIGESEKLYDYLSKRFKEIDYHVDIPVLNANVDKLEEEAKIIAKAGLPRAITISTEMAGRGTDIKLGGEIPTREEIINDIVDETVQRSIELLVQKGAFVPSSEENLRKIVLDRINKGDAAFDDKIKKRMEDAVSKRSFMHEEVLKAGGLKVIGSGHFSYSRVDDQVRGRAGRQGDPGETIFVNDREDLLRIGVPKSKVDELQKKAEILPIKENDKKGFTPITDAILEAQTKTETMVKESIKQNQEIEKEVARYRKDLRAQKDAMRQNNDYIDVVRYMEEQTIKSIIVGSCHENPSLNSLKDKMRISSINLDIPLIMSLTKEFLGVEVAEEQIKACRRIGDLKEMLTEVAMEHFEEVISQLPQEETNKKCKVIVDRATSRIWNDFENCVEGIRHQRSLNGIFQTEMGLIVPAEISMAYAHCVESQKAMAVRELVNPKYKENGMGLTEIVPMRLTSAGFKVVSPDYDEKMEQAQKDVLKEARPNIKNLLPTPKMFTLVNDAVLSRNAKVGNGDKSFDFGGDLVSSIDFESSDGIGNHI